jgi:hypothetical protein
LQITSIGYWKILGEEESFLMIGDLCSSTRLRFHLTHGDEKKKLSFCHTSYPTKMFNPCEVQRIMPLWKGFMPSSPQMSMWRHTYWHCKRRTSKFLKMSSMLVCSLHNFFCFILSCANYKTFALHLVLLGSISQMLPSFHINSNLCNVEFLKFPHNNFLIWL